MYEHIRPVLSSLHWRQLDPRIKLKVAVMTFKIDQSVEPSYLASLMLNKIVTRSLQSLDKCFIEISIRIIETAKHSFSSTAHSIWNSLPDIIHQLDSIIVSNSTLTLWTPEDGIPTFRKRPNAAKLRYTVQTASYQARRPTVYHRYGS